MLFESMSINEFNKIMKIIEKYDEVKLDFNIPPFGNRIHIFSEECESELYIKKSLNALIISRVQFKNTRIGIMTKVLEELKKITRMYGYNKIVVESVLTKEMSNFCLKNEFKRLPNLVANYNEYVGDYELILERN